MMRLCPLLLLPSSAALLLAAGPLARIGFSTTIMQRHLVVGRLELPPPASLPIRATQELEVTVEVRPDGTVSDVRRPKSLIEASAKKSTTPAREAEAKRIMTALLEPIRAAARDWRFQAFTYRGTAVAATGDVKIRYRARPEWRDAAAPFPATDPKTLRVTLYRSACYGTCPDYRVAINEDGSTLFTTEVASLGGAAEAHREYSPSRGVLVPGTHRGQVAPPVLARLVEQFRAAHFFGLKPEYRATVTDNPTYTLTVSTGGRTMTVVDYVGRDVGMPAVVTDLEQAVDEATGTARWVKGDAGTADALAEAGLDLRSEMATEITRKLVDDHRPQAALAMIAHGVPLDAEVAGEGGKPIAFGSQLLTDSIATADRPVFEELARRGWLTRTPIATLGQTFAVSGGGCDPAIASALVRAGVDPNVRTREASMLSSEYLGETALFMAVQGFGCAQNGSDAGPIISALLKLGVDVNARDEKGRTVLFGLADPDIQDQLLAAGANARLRDKAGRSAALSAPDDRTALALLDAGAEAAGKDDGGTTLREKAHDWDWPATLAWLDAHVGH